MIPRKVYSTIRRILNAVGRTVSTEAFLLNSAFAGGILAIAVAIGLYSPPAGLGFAGAASVTGAFLYVRSTS